jgi:hypothetical protein
VLEYPKGKLVNSLAYDSVAPPQGRDKDFTIGLALAATRAVLFKVSSQPQVGLLAPSVMAGKTWSLVVIAWACTCLTVTLGAYV